MGRKQFHIAFKCKMKKVGIRSQEMLPVKNHHLITMNHNPAANLNTGRMKSGSAWLLTKLIVE